MKDNEYYCGCCGRPHDGSDPNWCPDCIPHIAPRCHALDPWDRTYYAQHKQPCPFEDEDAPRCRRCGSEMRRGKALMPTVVGAEDFGGDAGQPGTTLRFSGPGRLVPCWKCPQCGHSITGGEEDVTSA